MGKLKRGRKNQQARLNPLKRKNQSSSSKDGEKNEKTRQSKIIPLIEKLSSSSPNDRSMALGAITVLCEDDKMRALLLKERLIAIILEKCLNDNNDEIVVEAFGLLRNIAIDEGYDVTKFYWRSNIWISLEAALSKIKTSFEFLKNAAPTDNKDSKKREDEKAKEALLYDFAEHVFSLIVVIASTSEDLYQNIFERIDPVLALVLELINYNISTSRLSAKFYNALLDFIYEFSSESSEFIQKLAEANFSLDAVVQHASNPTQENNRLGKIYVDGLKFHINEVVNTDIQKDKLAYELLNSLFSSLAGINLEEIKKSILPSDNANQPIQAPSNDEKPEDINQQIGGVSEEKALAAINLQSIEIVIDLTTTIWEFLAFNEDGPGQSSQVSSELINLIFTLALPSIYELVSFNAQNDQVLGLTDKLVVCLNNLAWYLLSLDSLPAQWFENSQKTWDLVIELSNTDDLVLQKDCLSVCWAVAKALGPEIRPKINIDMIQALISKCQSSLQAESAGNEIEILDFYLVAVGLTGTIAPIIDNTEITKTISEFLMSSLDRFLTDNNGSHKVIELIVEIINLLFVIFGDKEYPYDHEIFVKGDYLGKLSQAEPVFKSIYKKLDKKKNPELKYRSEDTCNNLVQFIKYKQSEYN